MRKSISIAIILVIVGTIIFLVSESTRLFTNKTSGRAEYENDIKNMRSIKGNLLPSIYGEEYITYEYSTNGAAVYYKTMLVEGADIASFTPIENGRYMHSYAKDKRNVYYLNKRILGADPQSFKVLWQLPPEGCRDALYSRDKNNVYFKNTIVIGADPESFVPLIVGPIKGLGNETLGEYGKDKNFIFKGTDKLINFSPEDFATACIYG